MNSLRRLGQTLVPRRLLDLFANCGGWNPRSSRFAGSLATGTVDDEQLLAICHSLIFPNGVRKTTSGSRNVTTLNKLLDDGLLPLKADLDVLDIGASIGLDATSTLRLLETRNTVRSYTLGDRYASILYDRRRNAVFDEDHHLLQVRRHLGFTSVNFSYNEPAQKLINLPKRLRPWLIERQLQFEDHPDVLRIPLVHPSIRLDGRSPFKLRSVDVFEPIDETYDLIICMHLLVPRYFSAETIALGEKNLASSLRVGGALVVGASEAGRVYVRTSESSYDIRPFAEVTPELRTTD